MKFIRKHKNINEGYFKSIDDIKENPEKYKNATIGVTAQKLIEEKYTPRILYYTYILIGKYLRRRWDTNGGEISFSKIVLKPNVHATSWINIDYNGSLCREAGYNFESLPTAEIKEVSDTKIQDWVEKYFNTYFYKVKDESKESQEISKLYSKIGAVYEKPVPGMYSPIKQIKFNGTEFIVYIKIYNNNDWFCFFKNQQFDVYTKVEKELSNLIHFPVQVKLTMVECDNEVPFPGKKVYDEISFVGDIDFDKFIKFVNRFENFNPPHVVNPRILHFYDVNIPSLSYLPEFPFKVQTIIFDSALSTDDFKYNLDSIGDFSKLMVKSSQSKIIFHPWAFDGNDVEKLTNGIISEYEFNLSRQKTGTRARTNSPYYWCSYCPFTNKDTSLENYRLAAERYKDKLKRESSED